MIKNIYDMDLHERSDITATFTIMRVPGGWIYVIGKDVSCLTTCFVPFSDEFEDKFRGAL